MRISGLTHSRHSIVQDNALSLFFYFFLLLFSFRPFPSSNFLRPLSLSVFLSSSFIALRPSHVHRTSSLAPLISRRLFVPLLFFRVLLPPSFLRPRLTPSRNSPSLFRHSSALPRFTSYPHSLLCLSRRFPFCPLPLSLFLALSLCQSLRPFPTSSFH